VFQRRSRITPPAGAERSVPQWSLVSASQNLLAFRRFEILSRSAPIEPAVMQPDNATASVTLLVTLRASLLYRLSD
jgi:hypothetical protein